MTWSRTPIVLIAAVTAMLLVSTVAGDFATPTARAQDDGSAEVDDAPAADDPEDASDPGPEREESLSPWWWVVVAVLALAAGTGLVAALARRNKSDDWVSRGSDVCHRGNELQGALADRTGAAISAEVLDEARDLETTVSALATSAPDGRAKRRTVAYGRALHHLVETVEGPGADDGDAPTAGTPLADQELLEDRIGYLATTLEELELAVGVRAAGALHPTGRPST